MSLKIQVVRVVKLTKLEAEIADVRLDKFSHTDPDFVFPRIPLSIAETDATLCAEGWQTKSE